MALRSQAARIVSVTDRPTTQRRPRRPRHTFNLKTKPYEIAPFMIAPVLPGETLSSLLMQSRVVTDPIQNSLIGWHKEYYFFYVKHRALNVLWSDADALLLQTQMLDPSTSMTNLRAAANTTPYYTFKAGIDYVLACTHAVIKEFFRDEDEAVNVASIENYFAAQMDQENWAHSMKEESATGDDTDLPGQDQLEETDVIETETGQYAQWEIMRDAGLTDATYEDFLRSYGVSIPKSEDQGGTQDEKHKPELIRFIREWSYPSNTVNPADGTVASAVSWSIAERADKKRFFKEPGFIFGVTVTRPKVYMGLQKGAAVGMLDSAYGWLPALLSGHPWTSVTEELDSATDGILQGGDEDYWVDLRDLFLYGDQFVNHTFSAAANHGLAHPVAATLQRKYPTDAMVESLFKTATTEYVREDGVVHLNILSRAGPDTTP